jgi:hypothetical protein
VTRDDDGPAAAVAQWDPKGDEIVEDVLPAAEYQHAATPPVRVREQTPATAKPDATGLPHAIRAHRPEFVLLTDAELEAVPPPEYQVAGIIVLESNVFIYGPPGSGKSFLAIEISRSIAAGRRALGLRTVQGPVVYIAAEGGTRGFAKRLRAWTAANNDGALVPDFWVVSRPVPMLDAGAVAKFIDDVGAKVGPRVGMFVIDTLARCTGGGDENSASDMGRFVAACDDLRATFGATVTSIHHSGKAADAGMRGSTALHGSADTELRVGKDQAGVITVTCTKQKDDDPPAPLRLRLEVVAGIGSCVLAQHDGPVEPEPDVLDKPRAMACIAALRRLGTSGSYVDWRKASGLPETTFNRFRSELVAKRFVEPLGDRYRVAREAEDRL